MFWTQNIVEPFLNQIFWIKDIFWIKSIYSTIIFWPKFFWPYIFSRAEMISIFSILKYSKGVGHKSSLKSCIWFISYTFFCQNRKSTTIQLNLPHQPPGTECQQYFRFYLPNFDKTLTLSEAGGGALHPHQSSLR